MTVVFATHDSTMVNTLRRRTLELSYGNLIRDDKKGGYSATNDPKTCMYGRRKRKVKRLTDI